MLESSNPKSWNFYAWKCDALVNSKHLCIMQQHAGFFFLMGIWVHHVKATINQRLLPSSDFISEMKVQHDDIEKILKVNVWIVSEACVLLLFQLFFLQFKNIYVWLSGNLKLCVGLIVHGCLVLWWTSNPSRLCPRTAGTGSSKPEQNKWVAGRNQNRNTVVQFDKSVI